MVRYPGERIRSVERSMNRPALEPPSSAAFMAALFADQGGEVTYGLPTVTFVKDDVPITRSTGPPSEAAAAPPGSLRPSAP